MEEDHSCILVIGGINILLPRIPIEVGACVVGAEEKGQPTYIVMEEQKEKTLKYSQGMKKEE
jgi:hypothetical protein